jgi:hypothetical protein
MLPAPIVESLQHLVRQQDNITFGAGDPFPGRSPMCSLTRSNGISVPDVSPVMRKFRPAVANADDAICDRVWFLYCPGLFLTVAAIDALRIRQGGHGPASTSSGSASVSTAARIVLRPLQARRRETSTSH